MLPLRSKDDIVKRQVGTDGTARPRTSQTRRRPVQAVNAPSFLGATEQELESRPSKRLIAMIDQRRLFPHRGLLSLEPEAIALAGWRDIDRSRVTSVELGFTPSYSRWMATGNRGRWPSLGWVASYGKPLVIGVRDEPPVYVLIDFTWWTGINESRKWLPRLTSWLIGAGGGASSPA